MKNLQRVALTLLLPLCLVLPVHAMTASQKVEVERQVKQADGTTQTVLTPPDTVLPGDMLVYTVSYFNDKQDVTDNFRLDMPIPAEIAYLEGSAELENANILYSTDNGETFKSRESLEVRLPSGASRLAAASDITHIRWTLTQSLQPGDQGEIRFKGRLK